MRVLYFSRTGNSRQVAEYVAGLMNTKPLPLSAPEAWEGLRGLVRYLKYRIFPKAFPPDITLDACGEEQVILVAPVWDGRLAPPAWEALKRIRREDTLLITLSKRSVIKSAPGCRRIIAIKQGDDYQAVLGRNLL